MKTLQSTLEHMSRVFGRRHRLYLPNVADRTFALLCAVDNIQDGVRKSAPKRELSVALAEAVVRTLCCVEAYGEMPFVEALAAKYPFNKCIYCNKRPCKCTEKRAHHVLAVPNTTQSKWSLKQWCGSFRATYGKKNKERGVYYCLMRLFGEVAEFAALQMPSVGKDSISEVLERDIAFELADVFAWIIAVANVLDIDLEFAVSSRYSKGCDVCKKKVCECAHYTMRRTLWRTANKKT